MEQPPQDIRTTRQLFIQYLMECSDEQLAELLGHVYQRALDRQTHQEPEPYVFRDHFPDIQ